MSSVDDRIVNMKFNNSQFGQGVDKTKRDLTGLEKTVTNVGKSKGMTQLGASADAVKVKFSALQVAGAAALGTIVAKATAAGLSIVKKLTIQPLIDGFKEYTTNLESIQTIMANTGKSVDVVNKYLGELNEYSDQTIYNFSQMAKNIGTFTAAGVELDTATSAIKGISNLAALSGSNSQQASTAMYQLSQAISAGKVGLQDWNSVVNAGMGGKVFKNALAQTAVAMGDLSKGAVKVGTDVEIMGDSFRQSISAAPGQTPWLTSDVLVTTLAQLDGRFSKTALAADGYVTKAQQVAQMDKARIELAKQGVVYSEKEYQAMVDKADAAYQAATQIKTATQLFQVVQESIGSMWAGAFQIVLGDFEQSKKLWGAVGDEVMGIIDGISGGFLGTLREWEERGGREKVLEGLGNVFGGLLDVMGAVKDAFRDIFPANNINLLHMLSKAFLSFSENLVPGKETLEDIRSIAGAAFAVLHFGFTIVKGVAKGLSAFFGALFDSTDGARGGILSMAGSVAEVIIAIENWLTSGGRIVKFLQGIGTVAGAALSPIVAAVGFVIDGFAALISGEGLGGAMDAFNRAGDVFGGFVGNILTGLDQLTAPLDPLKDKIRDLALRAVEPFQPLIDILQETKARFTEGLGIDSLGAKFDSIKGKVSAFFADFSLGSLDGLGDSLGDAAQKIGQFIDSLDISDKIANIRDSISGLFDGLFGGEGGGAGGAAGATALVATAETTGDAFGKLGDIVSAVGDGIKAVFGFIGDVIGGIVDGLASIPFPDDALEWATVLNYIIGGAILKKVLFSKDIFEELAKAIVTIADGAADAFDQLTGTLKTMQGGVKAHMIMNIAIAVGILAASLIALSFVPQEKLASGLGALAAVMGMMALMMKFLLKGIDDIEVKDLLAKSKALLSFGVAMVLIATSVAILAAAVAMLAFIPMKQLATGLGAVAILLALVVGSMLILSKFSKNVVTGAAAMVAMATAIMMLSLAVAFLGQLDLETLAKGIGSIAIMMAVMVGSLLLLSKFSKNVVTGAAAIIALATAMVMLSGVVALLGQFSLETLAKGLGSLAIMLVLVTGALLLLSMAGGQVALAGAAILMVATSLVALAGVVAFLGALPLEVLAKGLGALAVGLGILLLAALGAMHVLPGLLALSIIIRAIGIAALMAGAGMLMFGTGLALIAAAGVAAIAVLVLAFQAFIALLPTIAVQIAAAFVQFVKAIALAAPKIRKAMVTIGREMIGTIRDLVPELGKLFDTMLATGITSIENSVPRFIELGFTIIDEFLKSAEAHIPSIVDSAVSLITYFLEEVGAHQAEMANAGLDLVVDVINGISDAIENSGRIREAAWNLVRTFGDEIREAMGDVLGAINPMNYLPDISVSDLRGMLPGGGNGRVANGTDLPSAPDLRGNKDKEPKKDPLAENLTKAINSASTVIANAVRLLVGAETGLLYALVRGARDLQREAAYAADLASNMDTSAVVAEDSASAAMDQAQGMKKGEKGSKQRKRRDKAIKAAKKAQKQARAQRRFADAQARKAALKQDQADFQDAMARDAVMYKDDAAGLGAARAQLGSDLASESNALAAQAQAKVDEAARLEKLAAKGGKNAKEYRKQAAELRKQAAAETAQSLQLSTQAIQAQEQAVAAYAAARREAALDVIARMENIRTQQTAEANARQWEKDYEAATNEGKIAMLEARIAENETKATNAQTALAAAYAQSDALNSKIARGEAVSEAELAAVEKAVVEAEKAAQDTTIALDAVEADRETVEQIQQQIAQANSSGGATTKPEGGGVVLTPSRSALEDAALAVDRYTASVAQAEEYATSGSTTPQFVQNNYSPEALSASTIYRQTNNLISAAEVKMGV